VDVSPLWIEPVDLASRDLYHGPGGPSLAPDPAAAFRFVAADRTGFSNGYDVDGPDGVRWSVKLGPEAQSEVAASRLLWAIGYHQPPAYYVPAWQLTGAQSGPQGAARFRPELPAWKVVSDWSWYGTDLVHTPAFKGLIVANVMLNNWDWKTSNNKVYEVAGAEGTTSRRYVVRDLGASLGKTTLPRILAWMPTSGPKQGTRNDLEGFEAQGFIKGVADGDVDFDYRGLHHALVDIVTPADVLWTSRLLGRLSDTQWHDAFRAAGYTPAQAGRFAAKLKAKVTQGLQLQ
jgi:hypothetical protein